MITYIKILIISFLAMPPLTSLSINSPDPLGLCLLDEHRQRYERIKAWREAQSDPYFMEVTPQWRDQFEKRQTAAEPQSE